MTRRRHVVIIGSGFGGLFAARALRRAPVDVTLIDRRNHHLFQPLLYQVATATLDPSDIASPIRSILRKQKNLRVLLGEVQQVAPEDRQVVLEDGGAISYDYLIIATGVTHSYFGNDAWAAHAPGLKCIEDALEIRRRVLLAYEAAERETDEAARRAYLTFVIIGAGPTGVELAGALAEISRKAMRGEFDAIDPSSARIVLVEGQARVLPVYPEVLSGKAQKQLEALGVELRLGARVTGIDERGVSLGEQRIEAATVLWAAGVAGSPVARSLGAPLDRAGRVKVTETMTVPGRDDLFVIGDLAYLEQDGKPIPGVSPAAMQAGRHVAQEIARRERGRAAFGDSVDTRPYAKFRYVDKGTFATIGRGAAVGEFFGSVKTSGLTAWMAWLLIHIFFLIGFRTRLFVMASWAYSYFTHRRGVRLITGHPLLPKPRHLPAPPPPRPSADEPGAARGP